MKHLLLSLLILITLSLKSQVSTDPALPTQTEKITIAFDATSTPLAGYTGEVYAHTGVTVNNNRWQHVIGDWGSNQQPKLTRIAGDSYELEIDPSINSFYGVASGEKVTELCFVFRNAESNKQTQDIFVTVYEAGLSVQISSPTKQPYFVDASSNFNIVVNGRNSSNTTVKIDGELKHTETASPNSFEYTVEVTNEGTHNILVEAHKDSKTVSAAFSYTVRSSAEVNPLPANVIDGINYIDDNTVTLVLHAPYKNSVYVQGSFNNWQAMPMNRTSGNIQDAELRYWCTITGLEKGKEYFFQYLIDENIIIADPYANKISDPWNDKYISDETYPNLIEYPNIEEKRILSIFQTAQEPYNWQVANFEGAKKTDLVIYELLVRDFAQKANYQTLIDTVQYFKNLGINAIELMPVNEFDGNNSWGYNPAFYFAPDKAYGTSNKLKEFIDVCHQNGIAVIVDMVLNHSFGQSPFVQMYWDSNENKPAVNNLWYNQDSPNSEYSWGYDFNHESIHTQRLMDRINKYWLEEYKVDGFRFDFTKGFTNKSGNGWAYDQSRIAILKRMYDQITAVKSDAYVICEHLTDNSEEKELANYGIMLWGNMNHQYTEAAMGFNDNNKSDLSWGYYKNRQWNKPNLISYMESHDEERMMYKILNHGRATSYYNIKDTATALQRIELDAAFFFTIPGPKMLWQFGELSYDVSIDDPGRVEPKPPKWHYYNDNKRLRLYQVFAALIKLKKEQSVFEDGDVSLSVNGKAKRIKLSNSDIDICIIGNFDIKNVTISPEFHKTGTWYDYFSGKSVEVTNVNEEITLAPGKFHIYTSKKLETPDIVNLTTGLNTPDNITKLETLTYPNPSSDRVNIEFELSKADENINISILGINGKKIKQLYSGNLSKGHHKYVWNLDNEWGSKVSKGVYILQIVGKGINGNKMLIVK